MGPSNTSFLSFGAIFHFHDYGRKGRLLKTNILPSQLTLFRRVFCATESPNCGRVLKRCRIYEYFVTKLSEAKYFSLLLLLWNIDVISIKHVGYVYLFMVYWWHVCGIFWTTYDKPLGILYDYHTGLPDSVQQLSLRKGWRDFRQSKGWIPWKHHWKWPRSCRLQKITRWITQLPFTWRFLFHLNFEKKKSLPWFLAPQIIHSYTFFLTPPPSNSLWHDIFKFADPKLNHYKPSLSTIASWVGGESHYHTLPYPTVDGSKKSGDHQLRLVVYPILYDGSYISQVVVWDFWTINSTIRFFFSLQEVAKVHARIAGWHLVSVGMSGTRRRKNPRENSPMSTPKKPDHFKRKGFVFPSHHFSGALAVNFREWFVMMLQEKVFGRIVSLRHETDHEIKVEDILPIQYVIPKSLKV